MTSVPSLVACPAILTPGLVPIWLPAPNLLIVGEAVTVCFACQMQTAGTNNPNKLPSISCKLCDGGQIQLSEAMLAVIFMTKDKF